MGGNVTAHKAISKMYQEQTLQEPVSRSSALQWVNWQNFAYHAIPRLG